MYSDERRASRDSILSSLDNIGSYNYIGLSPLGNYDKRSEIMKENKEHTFRYEAQLLEV